MVLREAHSMVNSFGLVCGRRFLVQRISKLPSHLDFVAASPSDSEVT